MFTGLDLISEKVSEINEDLRKNKRFNRFGKFLV